MKLRIGAPVWLSQKHEQEYPTLRGRHEADVVIIGGGITGASIAEVFAHAGVRAVLLEAGLVGRGSTAASTALLLQETDEEFAALEKRYGRARATRIWELSRRSIRDLIATVRQRRIACSLAQRDTVYYTLNPASSADLHAEYRRRRRAGFSAKWLDPVALLADTRIAGQGAIRSRGNAQLDPYRACAGLLRVAASDGARVFERSAVRHIDTSRAGVVVRTRDGVVAAQRIIVATGYATRAFAPLAGRFAMKHTYVLATRPVTDAERRRLGLGALLLWDTERPYHYARWGPGQRLLLGGNDRPLLPRSRRKAAFASSIQRLREYFVRLLPTLGDIEIEAAWEGLFAMTPDGLPFIGSHRRYPRHLFALGYGGNGMSFGFLASRLLLDAYRNAENPDLQLFAFNRFR